MAEKKFENVFKFAEHSFSDLLKKTTLKDDWSESLGISMKFDSLRGEDADVKTDLLELKNPKLVFSLMLHFLGRGLYCSSNVHEKFKHFLKDHLIKSCQNVIPETNEYAKKIFRFQTFFSIQSIFFEVSVQNQLQ